MSVPPSSVTITGTNQTALIMDVNVMTCNKDDSTLFQIIAQEFFEYPHCTGVGTTDFNSLPGDTIIMKTQFHLKLGTQTNPITMKNHVGYVHVYRQVGVEGVVVESIAINTSGFIPNCDNIQEIEFEQAKDYKLPTDDCRMLIRLHRMPTLDIAGYAAYEFVYPFKIRWEEWISLATSVDQLSVSSSQLRCFPTPTQNWMVYANQAGWTPAFVIKAEVYDASTNHTTEFEHIAWGTIKDPCDIPYTVEINTFDDTGLNSFEEIVAADQDTYVVATITGDFSGFAESQLYGILSLDAWGVGGVTYVEEIGTRVDADDTYSWHGTGSTMLATLTKVNNSTVTLSAYIDYTKLPKDTNQFILSARIGEYRASMSSSGSDCITNVMIDAFTCGQLEIISVTSANVIVVRGAVVTAELRDIFIDNMILTFVTATTWTVSGGTIDGYPIRSGSVAGNIIKAPTHPYTNAIVGDTIQGSVTGTLYSTTTEDGGIGSMQIGCSFFVS